MAGTSHSSLAKTRPDSARLVKVGAALAKTAERTGEMGVAAATTIGIRTNMMVRAAGDPVAMADPEFTLMVCEKVEAAVESGLAMGAGLPTFHVALATWLSSQAAIATHAISSLAQCRTPADVAAVQSRTFEALHSAGTAASARLAEAAVVITGAGLDPVHRTVSANAKRLTQQQH